MKRARAALNGKDGDDSGDASGVSLKQQQSTENTASSQVN